MVHPVVGQLATQGILERAGLRREVLRVSPRFMAHVEGTAGRLHLLYGDKDRRHALRDALATWDGLGVDLERAMVVVRDLLDDRGQWGRLADWGGRAS